MKAIVAAAFFGLSACATIGQQPLAQQSRYVSMGSSYAAGAQIGPLVPGSPARCGRTQNNYAHLLATRLKLDIVDVSCGGATTAHILGPWLQLPPQIDAVTSDTKLVTLTIGGNDLRYVTNLMAASCSRTSSGGSSVRRPCPPVRWPASTDYEALEQHLRDIAREVHRRAPQARLVFVEYLSIVPAKRGCAEVPLDQTEIDAARDTLRHMAEVTKKVAKTEGASLLPMGELSKSHEACSADPWGAGHPGKPADWHPTTAGHVAIAKELAARLK